jgi:hypothetical protein
MILRKRPRPLPLSFLKEEPVMHARVNVSSIRMKRWKVDRNLMFIQKQTTLIYFGYAASAVCSIV